MASYNLEEEEQYLASYLETVFDETTMQQEQQHDDASSSISNRLHCCEISRSLYCSECYQTLVPKQLWPKRIISSSFPFPAMDIILGTKERRTSSTGIQMMCICRMIAETAVAATNNHLKQQQQQHSPVVVSEKEKLLSSENNNNNNASSDEWWNNVKLYDLNRDDEVLPPYAMDDGTFVLFPAEGKSVPISSVAHKIKRLIVLDIKWTRSANVKLFSDQHKLIDKKKNNNNNKSTEKEKHNPLAPLNSLPFVHLEFPPRQSHYWRWHNRGKGMLSTIEAIYFASREMGVAKQQHDNNNNNKEEDLVNLLWLFALQRSIIQNRCQQEGRLAAFSEEEKAHARALRNNNPLMKRRKLKNVDKK